MIESGIYRINLGNGNFYIGSSNNLQFRVYNHISTLKRGVHNNQRIQRNWDKYGVFLFGIIELCPVPELLQREQFFLDIHFGNNKNVNMLSVAGSRTGFHHSVETKKKLSEKHTGKHSSVETRKKISLGNIRRYTSEEERKKTGRSSAGRKHSDESRKKMAKSRALWWATRRVPA